MPGELPGPPACSPEVNREGQGGVPLNPALSRRGGTDCPETYTKCFGLPLLQPYGYNKSYLKTRRSACVQRETDRLLVQSLRPFL